MDQISAVYISTGLMSEGLSVEISYRCVGQPHVFQYLSTRQLLPEEASDLLHSVVDALVPGRRPPAVAGQTALF